MSVSRYCPACGSFALAFEAAATHKNSNVIAVVGRCQHCKYKFRHDFSFSDPSTDHANAADQESNMQYRPDSTPAIEPRKRESAVKQHQRWLGQDRQMPGQAYEPGRVSTPPVEGPPENQDR